MTSREQPASTCVVGFGSPHGDDQVGWQLVSRLAARELAGAVFHQAASPLDLLAHLSSAARLVLIDACRTGAAPGTIVRWEWPLDCLGHLPPRSTHGLGLREALSLAETMGLLPGQIVLFGMEMQQAAPGTGLSTTILQACEELERRLVEEILGRV
jgi:hydrogenase maturation protease